MLNNGGRGRTKNVSNRGKIYVKRSEHKHRGTKWQMMWTKRLTTLRQNGKQWGVKR